jgi:hypothetical protein
MRKYLIAAALAVALVIPAAMPAGADAARYCPVHVTDYTRGGWTVEYHGAMARGMNCSSVRYALGEFRAKIRRQVRRPRMPRAFFDGYVTWNCYKLSYYRQRCYEVESETSYTFSARVY